MIEVKYRRGPVSIDHVWFYEKDTETLKTKSMSKAVASGLSNRAILYFCHGMTESLFNMERTADSCFVSIQEQNSLINNLTISEEELWSGIKKNYKYEIKRCEKDGIERRILSSEDVLKDRNLINLFKNTYDGMFRVKGIDTTFNDRLFMQYLKCRSLVITLALRPADKEPSVYHAYITDGVNSRFWYSCSTFREKPEEAEEIGRMNKALHWFDFIELKRLGIRRYDWGGINFDDEKIKGISEFKRRFGGQEISYRNIILASNSIAAKVARCFVNR